LAFLSKIALAILGLLCFHMNFRIDFYISVKNDVEIMVEIAFNSLAIFTTLILLIHEHERSFHLISSVL
jgi:hypothetical protein